MADFPNPFEEEAESRWPNEFAESQTRLARFSGEELGNQYYSGYFAGVFGRRVTQLRTYPWINRTPLSMDLQLLEP